MRTSVFDMFSDTYNYFVVLTLNANRTMVAQNRNRVFFVGTQFIPLGNTKAAVAQQEQLFKDPSAHTWPTPKQELVLGEPKWSSSVGNGQKQSTHGTPSASAQ